MSSIKYLIRFLFIAALLLYSFVSFSQWDSVGVIYSGNGVKVSVLYKLKSDSCEPNSSKISKYKYFIIGKPNGKDLFLNWKMDYLDCDGKAKAQTNSVNIGKISLGEIVDPDFIFNGFKIIKPYYSVITSNKPDITPVKAIEAIKSIPAEGIIIPDIQVSKGSKTTLKVKGGQLFNGSNWVWYQNNLNSEPIGKGEQISVIVQHSCTYYVRAEGQKDTSNSIGARVNVSGATVLGWDSIGTIYSGNGVQVNLMYKLKPDSCEENSNKKSKYKYFISGKPNGNDLYLNWKMDYLTCSQLIMAQTNSLNIGKTALGEIVDPDFTFNGFKIIKPFYEVKDSPTPDNTPVQMVGGIKNLSAEKIIYDDQVFKGDRTILKVQGGQLGYGAQWVWYKDSVNNNNNVGTGEQLSVVCQNSCNYFVRAEGIKDTSSSVSAKMNVLVADWELAGTLYNENGFQIKLLYKLNSDTSNKNYFLKSRYKYETIGNPKDKESYLNWKMDYLTNNGSIIAQTNSVNFGKIESGELFTSEYTFSGFKLMKPFYDAKISQTPDNTPLQMKAGMESKPADKIIREDKIFSGEPTILKVQGGRLGYEAKWVWYKDNCNGKPVGTGEQISVIPLNNCTYYVRAEGMKDTSSSIGTFVKISETSIIGENIEGQSLICKGQQNVQLKLIGGKLGKSSTWKWYKDECGGKSIGTGKTIEVSPSSTTSYFVRAEGANETSVCIRKEIVVTDFSKAPENIVGNSITCYGESLNLSISGGKLATDANWVWYEKKVSENTKIGKGEKIILIAENSTQYLVRAEGSCNNTEPISKLITVNTVSISPNYIEANNLGASSYLPKGKYVFTVSGGSLSGNSKWVWYKKNADDNSSEKIGEGDSIKMRFKRTTTLMVRAEGNICDKNNGYYKKEFTLNDYKANGKSGNAINYLNFGLVSSLLTANSNISPTSPTNLVVSYARNSDDEIGWYIKGKYCINSVGQSDYQTTDAGTITSNGTNSTTPMFNGNVAEERYGATIGGLYGPKNFRLFIGVGWGKRELKWGVNEYQTNSQTGQLIVVSNKKWASNSDRYYEGTEIELGFILRLWVFNIQAGISNIMPPTKSTESTSPKSWKYFDTHAGIGFNF